MEMAEAELQKQRLQAIAEKRRRQAEIEDKRHQLEDKILQLQHHKSKATRERWLLQGIPAVSAEEEDARSKQLQSDESKAKKLEEAISRLEVEIEQLESEESQIAAKEQFLREKLREAEKSIKDLQKGFSNPDGAMYAMEVNVQKDKLTGETKILSTAPLNTEGVHQRGVAVYDNGSKVVYEVCSGSAVVENGVHHLTTSEVDQLKHRAGRKNVSGSKYLPESLTISKSSASPDNTRSPGDSGLKKDMIHKEAKLEMVPKAHHAGKAIHQIPTGEAPKASAEHPVTMIFMGYQNVEDEEETNKLLGYEGAIQAELVLIDEDDEKSLREKTVTDVSTVDGNAAELVAGKSMTEASETLSAEENEGTDTGTEPATGEEMDVVSQPREPIQSTVCGITGMEKTTMKPSASLLEDDTELKKGKSRKRSDSCVSVQLSPGQEGSMEIDSSLHSTKNVSEVTPKAPHSESAGLDDQLNHVIGKGQNSIQTQHESLDSDVAKEIRYLDEVLEANCCDSVLENGSNAPASPELSTAIADGQSPPLSTRLNAPRSPDSSMVRQGSPPVEQQDTDDVKAGEINLNGHSTGNNTTEPLSDRKGVGREQQEEVSPRRKSFNNGEATIIPLKKEAKFELRAFHEDKKPSKLFVDDDKTESYRIKKTRASSEIAELERARLEVIRSQVVKKNPSIAEKWKPPQEKTIEEQLDPDKLESHKKYAERKQKKQSGGLSPVSPRQKAHVFVTPDPIVVNREDVVTEQIDFSAARQQFLKMETRSETSTQPNQKRLVANKGVSLRSGTRTADTLVKDTDAAAVGMTELAEAHGQTVQIGASEVSVGKASKLSMKVPGGEQEAAFQGMAPTLQGNQQQEEVIGTAPLRQASPDQFISNSMKHHVVNKVFVDDEGFTQVRAVLTMLNEDGDSDVSDQYFKCVSLPATTEELDSGLDELSVRSQDTTVMETLSNDLSIDNVSDSGASNETMNVSLDYSLGGSQEFSHPQTPQALTPVDRERDESSFKAELTSSPLGDGEPDQYRGLSDTDQELQYRAEMLVQNAIQLALAQHSHTGRAGMGEGHPTAPSQLIRVVTNEQVPVDAAGATLSKPRTATPEPSHAPMPGAQEQQYSVPKGSALDVKCGAVDVPQASSPPSLYKPEFSPFSDSANYLEPTDYSRNNVFVSHSQEPEVIAQTGPFKLRTRRQKTLSMIEQEIRAAQDREEELRRQREVLRTVQRPTTAKQATLPQAYSSRTTPGKIEKSGSVSPSTESPTLLPQPDCTPAEQEPSGPGRSRGLMETLLEDFEIQKVKRRERRDEPNVLEATRVTRRKSAMALRWEAGIYANHEEQQ
ncbi:A-kinase anchor protein 2-like isoform X3 [Stegostoma tigrinum]|uniref:A-kinase anchor protein 2-like isoform X3 n=1 Tax=Stegostoma tigrinum TaxID=3053191 RepID=UPI002870AC1F|nr:A-kinase anchor protein 2-like isoform X3 [Stegostoma tigrinum]